MDNIKLFGITTTYNCEKLVPFVMKYHELLGYDKIIVYDNESTDNTVSLLKEYPFVEVRTYSTQGRYLECSRIMTMAECAREIMQYNRDCITWINVFDFDEVLFYRYAYEKPEAFKIFLYNASLFGYNVISEDIVGVLSDHFKPVELDKDKLVHTQMEYMAFQTPFYWNKPSFFRSDNCMRHKMFAGQHIVNFEFFDAPIREIKNTRDIFRFHLKWIFGAEDIFQKHDTYFLNGNSGYINSVFGNKKENIDKFFDAVSIPMAEYIKNKQLTGKNLLEENNIQYTNSINLSML